MEGLERGIRRLALYPQSRGLAYVVMEGQQELVEWGRYSIRVEKTRQTLKQFRRLLERFEPMEIVLEDHKDPDLKRCKRVIRLIKRLAREAKRAKVEVASVTRAQMSHAFRGRDVRSKDDRAVLIAHLFPALLKRLPPRRELWMSENENMAIFDAMALLLAVVGLPSEPLPGLLDRLNNLLS